jgi:serine/threonine-protein kinase
MELHSPTVEPGLHIADKYELVRQIGVGGMGEVWAAHHARIDRHVAIKFPNVDLVQRPEIRERFFAEARILGRLRHPNIVDVIDFGELDNGGLFLVFELLDGMSLDAYVQELGRLASRNAVMIALELCRGLAFAHEANVIHRDLKPANVFLHKAPNGRLQVKLLDFGISKICTPNVESTHLTEADAVVGTPAYMSYEQARAVPDIDARTDIWSAGVILYEMLAGIPPFEAQSFSATIAKIVTDPVPPLSTWGANVPADLEALVQRCLEKNRDDRFRSAAALQAALEAVLPRLSEPPPSRRLQLDSLTDLPTIPPPPVFAVPSAPSSSLRIFSPCARTTNGNSAPPEGRPSLVTPSPSHASLPAPAEPRSRSRLVLGAFAMLAVGAGIASLASYLVSSPPDSDAASMTPASGIVLPQWLPPPIPSPRSSSSAALTAFTPAAPPGSPDPVLTPKTTRIRPPPAKATPTTDATKRPATLVDDPGF